MILEKNKKKLPDLATIILKTIHQIIYRIDTTETSTKMHWINIRSPCSLLFLFLSSVPLSLSSGPNINSRQKLVKSHLQRCIDLISNLIMKVSTQPCIITHRRWFLFWEENEALLLLLFLYFLYFHSLTISIHSPFYHTPIEIKFSVRVECVVFHYTKQRLAYPKKTFVKNFYCFSQENVLNYL